MPLYQLKNNQHCVIEQMPDHGLMDCLGLRCGAQVRVSTKQAFGGPIVVRVGTRNIALAKTLADEIMVRVVN